METKKLLLGLSLVGILGGNTAGVSAVSQQQAVYILANKITRQTHKLVWDVDGVLLKNRVTTKAALILKNIPSILCAFAKHPVVTYSLLKQAIFKDKNAPAASAEEWQQTFRNLSTKNSFEHQFADFVQQWGEQKEIISGMETLIPDLKDRGFSMSIWTNMGTQDDAFFANKFPNIYNAMDFRSATTYQEGVAKIKKPSKEATDKFVACDKEFNGTEDTRTTIFIDDALKNCLAGKEFAGFNYIHFKSPEQLRAVLQEHGAFE